MVFVVNPTTSSQRSPYVQRPAWSRA